MDKILEGNYDDNIDDEQPRVTKEEMRCNVGGIVCSYSADKLTSFTDPDADNVDYYRAVKRLTDPTKILHWRERDQIDHISRTATIDVMI